LNKPDVTGSRDVPVLDALEVRERETRRPSENAAEFACQVRLIGESCVARDACETGFPVLQGKQTGSPDSPHSRELLWRQADRRPKPALQSPLADSDSDRDVRDASQAVGFDDGLDRLRDNRVYRFSVSREV
jgi:hypothetical protein